MNIWLLKNDGCNEENNIDISGKENIETGDNIYIYTDENETGMFLLQCKYVATTTEEAIKDNTFSERTVDLPYSVYYKTKGDDNLIKLLDKDTNYILNIDSASENSDDSDCIVEEEQIGQFAKEVFRYLNQYDELSKIVPYVSTPNEHKNVSITYNDKNLTSVFKVSDTELSEEDYTQGGRPRNFSDFITNASIGQYIYISTEWSNNDRGRLDLKSLISILDDLYAEFIFHSNDGKYCMRRFEPDTTSTNDKVQNQFKNFLKRKEISPEEIVLKNINTNIQFNVGQPNTGKSYNFEESRIFDGVKPKYYKYLKIPVSGGVGNEYKGLQNTDLAITYDPIKKELRFGEFLQMLMSAIVNPKVPHVVFLDDFHNQDISSLLSEYTPLFKGQQKRSVSEIDATSTIYNSEFKNIDDFIEQWNDFISIHCNDAPIVPLTNRISGDSLKLVYPNNFFLLGAANFNENSLNIFADWEDRAEITYKNPIETFIKSDFYREHETDEFLKCCLFMNEKLKEILKSKDIFDYEKYCFGMWKIVTSDKAIIIDEDKEKTIKFFFGMIRNALKFNNKNSEINKIGWGLMRKMQENDWFKTNIIEVPNTEKINNEILHQYNIYEDEI